jgi:cellulose synthase/poly-beta-1,6-N-acetylglucosamine synthase-like glycosyltransferase
MSSPPRQAPDVRHAQLSIVVPAYNEEPNIERAYGRLHAVLEEVGLPWELIFSVDPSSDRTEELIAELRGRDQRVKMLRFSRRFGQPMAILAGMQAARGEAVVVIDSFPPWSSDGGAALTSCTPNDEHAPARRCRRGSWRRLDTG